MRRVAFALAAAAALAAAGCISHKTGLDLPDPRGLVAGRTTRTEVYERFGLPDRILRRDGNAYLLYEVGGGAGYAVGAGWRSFGFSTSETRYARRSLEIRLDPSDRVAAARWTDESGRLQDLRAE